MAIETSRGVFAFVDRYTAVGIIWPPTECECKRMAACVVNFLGHTTCVECYEERKRQFDLTKQEDC